LQYNNGIPDDSRFSKHIELPFIKERVDSFDSDAGKKVLDQIRALSTLAEQGLCIFTFFSAPTKLRYYLYDLSRT
jgi:hypothetical protein